MAEGKGFPAHKNIHDKSGHKSPQHALIDPEEYTLLKRLPPSCPRRDSDVYVTNRTNFKGQLERCQKLLDRGLPEIYIHGLGNAINRAINIALQLKARSCGTLEVSANTSTIELTDELKPRQDDLDPDFQTRLNSSVHIKVYRPLQDAK